MATRVTVTDETIELQLALIEELHAITWESRSDQLLRTAAEVERLAATVVQALVDVGREGGHTWEQVGRAFGVTRQAAQQRFGE